ncbi:alpha/beta hydrolase fold domain-containing protein [Aliiglaciecola sp. CAU 1673]|uniref:alpha/beta hydrolase n=1 Tax=Aliiglaciecola sp. CAU 1673 TaxID=3032595 RepID=UPI0023DBBC2A|nr:alpha/beta hydrolase fold domain-containing protein [Aliiglaciecola sp. CAU 1673]MDF2177965.1 alpha/beta hydrolase fold domain-containing protein [Aliiglaciecola sp. CAU 1673]
MSTALPYVEVNPSLTPDAVVIWLHGLGDSGNGFAPIVPQLRLPASMAVRFVFPHAPVRPVTINNGMQMRAWYDIKSLDFNNRADVQGVEESVALVRQLLEDEMAKGISSERIILAGFSQGGVIAYHLGLSFDKPLAGIMALSTYMCEPQKFADRLNDANRTTPVLVAHGLYDEVVPCALGKQAHDVLLENGIPARWREYPMQHNVCMEEIQEISHWLQQRLG